MVIKSVIQIKSLYIHIENNEELNFLRRVLDYRLKGFTEFSDPKEKEFVNKLYLELWKMEMTK